MAPDDISRGQAERLRGLDEAARVGRTFEVLAGKGALWVWGDEDETLFTEDADRRTLLPIWPHATVARLENEGEVADEFAVRVPLKTFLTEWLPQLDEDGALISIFPVELRSAAVLTPAQFRDRLDAAV